MKFIPSFKILLMASCVAVLGACSAIKLGYNNAGTVAYTYLSSKVDLDAEQSALLETSLSEAIQWHRNQELPILSRELLKVQQQLAAQKDNRTPSPVSHEQVQAVYQSVRASLQRTVNHAAPLIARNLLMMNPSQLQDIQTALDKSNKEYREKFLPADPRARHQDLAERTEDRYENWLGQLNPRQKARIGKWAHAETQHLEQRFGARLQRQQEFMKLSRAAANRQITQADLTSALIELMNAWQIPRTEAEKINMELRQKAATDLTVEVLNMADMDQRKHAAKRAASWAEDFQILAKG